MRVRRIAGWAGWCSPCGSDDRPLVLTRTGPGGLRAWLSGVGEEDRTLLLTCNLCGHWQVVPAREQDDPQVVVPAPRAWQVPAQAPAREAVVLDLTARRTVVLPGARTTGATSFTLPAPRAQVLLAAAG